jgi:hypothetical protein
MACGCGRGNAVEPAAQKNLDEIANSIGFLEIFNQAQGVAAVSALANGYLQKAQRAESLGFGADVSSMYEQAAAREANQAVRQIDAVIARIDNRTAQPDWDETLSQVQQAFQEHDGPLGADAMKERFRLALLDQERLSPDLAELAQSLANNAFGSLIEEGLNGPVRLLREALLKNRGELPTPTAEIRPAGLSVNQNEVNCIAVATAIAAAWFIACCFVPWCWCCQSGYIALMLGAAVAICLVSY